MANIGLGQLPRGGGIEAPLVTSGDDVADVARFIKGDNLSYTAADVVDYLLSDLEKPIESMGGAERQHNDDAPATGGLSSLATTEDDAVESVGRTTG